jgi:hypothetical protein
LAARRDDRELLGSSVLFQVRIDAADEMYRIDAAYEACPGLTPPLSIELTPVHDPGRCRQRRLAAELAKAEEVARRIYAPVRQRPGFRTVNERIARLRTGGPPYALVRPRRL